MKKLFTLCFTIATMVFTTVSAQTLTDVSEDGQVTTTTSTVGNITTISRVTNVNSNQLIATEHYKTTRLWGTKLKDWDVIVVNDSGTIVYQDNSERNNNYQGYNYYRNSDNWYTTGYYQPLVPYCYIRPNYRVYGGYYQSYNIWSGYWINVGYCYDQVYNHGYYWNGGCFYNQNGYAYYNRNRVPCLDSRYGYYNYNRTVNININRNGRTGNNTVWNNDNPANQGSGNSPRINRNLNIDRTVNRTNTNNTVVRQVSWNSRPVINRNLNIDRSANTRPQVINRSFGNRAPTVNRTNTVRQNFGNRQPSVNRTFAPSIRTNVVRQSSGIHRR